MRTNLDYAYKFQSKLPKYMQLLNLCFFFFFNLYRLQQFYFFFHFFRVKRYNERQYAVIGIWACEYLKVRFLQRGVWKGSSEALYSADQVCKTGLVLLCQSSFTTSSVRPLLQLGKLVIPAPPPGSEKYA